MFGELFHAVVKFSLLEIYKVSVGGFPFLPPNGFPPATFLSLTPYNPPYPVEKHKRHCVFPLYEELFFFPDKSWKKTVPRRTYVRTRAYARENTRKKQTPNISNRQNAVSPAHTRVYNRQQHYAKTPTLLRLKKLTKHEMESNPQHPEIDHMIQGMQRLAQKYGKRITNRQLDVRLLTVCSLNGWRLTLERVETTNENSSRQ